MSDIGYKPPTKWVPPKGDVLESPAVARPHARLSPSAAYRWTMCPGSVLMAATVPEPPSSPYAVEGTRLHELAVKILSSCVGHEYPDDLSVDDREILEPYVNFVRGPDGSRGTIWVEKKVSLLSVSPDVWGTADSILAIQALSGLRKAVITDLKTGNTIVEPRENPQLLIYAAAAIETLDLRVSEVELVIVQPRPYHLDGPVRSWTVSVADLIDWLAWLGERIYATESSDAPLVPGDHCRWCPAAAVCPALRDQNTALAVVEFSPGSFDPAQLSMVLESIPRVDAWCRSVERFAQNELECGRFVPGWKLVAKRATRQWAENDDETLSKLEALGIDPMAAYETGLRSPAQVERLLPKERRKELAPLIVSRSSGSTLAPESDPRKSVRSPADRAGLEFTSVEPSTDATPKQE